ncbi:uncharacterized protein LOC124940730 [Impatiens glandulifera]|uniref:uncharacterized protein LOC124940730 n=1 Tax=Impatiens glandulifera TaxID=253017 RepID=UPI001FB0AD73|nr:uncharacterized protein LOC124940730 [Impatiens glandulifera]
MAEDICFINKETLIHVYPQKKQSIQSRTILIMFSMLIGIYICWICIEQSKTLPISHNEVIDRPRLSSCHFEAVDSSQLPYLHYPKPDTFSRDECECNPVRLFVIVSEQRSGSGWFETLLNSHVNVSCNGEIFSIKERRTNISSIVKTLDKVYNLDLFTSASKNHCSAAVGFKWMLNQGLINHHKEIVEYFNRRGVSLVFVLRRNLLSRMVSTLANSYDRYAKLLNGVHKSHVHSPREAKILSRYKPTIDSESLVSNLDEMKVTMMRALEIFKGTRHMVLYYEDVVKNQNNKLVEVQKFLKLPVRRLSSMQVKIHTGRLSNHIMNWEEVYKTLKGTAYERFLGFDY